MPGPSVFPSGEPGVSGDFWGSQAGLILRCAGKAGNPFQTTQGNRLSCRDHGSDWGQEEKGMTEDEMAGWHH